MSQPEKQPVPEPKTESHETQSGNTEKEDASPKPKKRIVEFLVKTPVPPGVQKVPYSFEIVHITLESMDDK